MRSRATASILVGLLSLAASGYAAPAGAAPATCEGVPATVVGTTGDDVLTGTPGDDVIAALAGNDTIDAGAGNDVVCGDAGSDQLTGGLGDDRLYGGDNGLVPLFENEPEPRGDTLVPGPGDDLVDVGVNTVLVDDGFNIPDTVDYSASATGIVVDLVSGVATGEGADALVVDQSRPSADFLVELLGTTHADHLLGTEGADQLIGNGGDDHIEGRGGDDFVVDSWDEGAPVSGASDDVFDGGSGADYLDSVGGTDVLLGGGGADHLRKEGGPTTMDGGPGRDELEVYLGTGRHTVSGGTGRDTISLGVLGSGRGARGVLDHVRERFVVRLSHRRPVRAAILDVERVAMPANPGTWTYLGTPGDDRVTGAASYTAKGRGGDDVLIGSYDDDVLLGGPGRDRIVGGRGDDRCRGEDLTGCEIRLW